MSDDEDFDNDRPSKSQIKRDMNALKDMGVRLFDLPDDQLERLSDPKLVDAVRVGRRIHRGSARKRQVQYIGKLLRDEAVAAEVQEILDRRDAGSRAHVQAFHQLEQWRERLVSGDDAVMDEIGAAFPEADRQHLRQLARKAAAEREKEATPASFRKLFQYLKSLTESG